MGGGNEGDRPGGEGDLPEAGAAIGGSDPLDRPGVERARVVDEADEEPRAQGGEVVGKAGGGRRRGHERIMPWALPPVKASDLTNLRSPSAGVVPRHRMLAYSPCPILSLRAAQSPVRACVHKLS